MTMIHPERIQTPGIAAGFSPPPTLSGTDAHGLDDPAQMSLRQLRHLTKNALQRVLCEVICSPGLQHHAAGRALAADLERRIHLSAAISDALFGLTRAPRSLDARLDMLSRAVVELMADTDQDIVVTVGIHGKTPASHDDTLVRIAHELLGNAVKHGMKLRMIGRIDVTLTAVHSHVVLTVADDGWGLCTDGANAGGLYNDGANAGGLYNDGANAGGLYNDGANAGGLRKNGANAGGLRNDGANAGGLCNDGANAGGLCNDAASPGPQGEGLRIAQLLASSRGGSVTLRRDRDRTCATAVLPFGDNR